MKNCIICTALKWGTEAMPEGECKRNTGNQTDHAKREAYLTNRNFAIIFF